MAMYQEGYAFYVKRCEEFGMAPLSLRYYVRQLSTQQLETYNEYARIEKGM